MNKTIKDNKKPHRQDLCAKCKALGHNCCEKDYGIEPDFRRHYKSDPYRNYDHHKSDPYYNYNHHKSDPYRNYDYHDNYKKWKNK